MQNALRLALNTMSLLSLEPQFVPVRFSTATHLHSERKRVEGKTFSNKTPASSRSTDVVLSGRAFQKEGEILSGFRKKDTHSQVLQEAEFAVVGIGIALLHSHARKAAFALNRSGDFAGAGREIALLPECSFELSAAVSCFSLAENGPLQPAAFLRPVSGLLCAHRKGAVCTSPWLHAECTTPTSEYYVSAFISSHNSF